MANLKSEQIESAIFDSTIQEIETLMLLNIYPKFLSNICGIFVQESHQLTALLHMVAVHWLSGAPLKHFGGLSVQQKPCRVCNKID